MTSVMKFNNEKFNRKINFSIWRVQIMVVLIQHGLKKALGGKLSMPVTMTDEQRNELDKKVLSAACSRRFCERSLRQKQLQICG